MNRNRIGRLAALLSVAIGAMWVSGAFADTVGPITFESPTYTTGSPNGQDGWMRTGSYDSEIVANSGAPASFGNQSLRISNGVTSGSFGDQLFSKPLVDEAGETSAVSNGFSGGVRQPYFTAGWEFISTTPGAEQSGLQVTVSPDRGDGARMSWIQMADTPGGIDINFYDYAVGNLVDTGPCACAPFRYTTVASGLDRTVKHKIEVRMAFVDGVENDVVQVLVDGVLLHTGTSWEDYFRNEEGNPTRPVDSLLFRTSGPAAPATLGKGFLIDNVTLSSGPLPPQFVQCTMVCYVNQATGNDANGGTAAYPKKTIQAGLDAVSPTGTVKVAKGTYAENLTIAKPLTLQGAGQNKVTVVPAVSNPNACSGSSLCGGNSSNVILVQANDVTITGLTVDGDNPALTSGNPPVGGADIDARNGIITDNRLPGTMDDLLVHHVTVRNIYLRGIYAGNYGSFSFHHNTVTNVQADPASIAMFAYGGGPGLMTDNTVSWANDAISANHSSGIQFLRNTVTHSASGVHTDNAGDGGGTADLIEDNTVTQCMKDGYGVWVFVPYIAPTVRHNTVKGCAVGLGLFGASTTNPTLFEANEADGQGATVTSGDTDGIVVWTTSFNWGDFNVSATVNGNVLRNFDYGVQVLEGGGKDATATFDRNLIRNNGTGLDSGAGTHVTLTGSCVRNNKDGGILNELGATTTANQNNILNNNAFGANNADTHTQDFESNFWGNVSGPKLTGPNKVIGLLDTTPFLTSAGDRCSEENWRNAGSRVNVNDHGDDGNSDTNNSDNHANTKPHGHENGDDR